jgi:hypothetical protein
MAIFFVYLLFHLRLLVEQKKELNLPELFRHLDQPIFDGVYPGTGKNIEVKPKRLPFLKTG